MYNGSMARGWESKSVEIQIEEAYNESRDQAGSVQLSTNAELRQKLEGLMLQRSRIQQQMESARNPRYREMLEETLNHLDRQLSALRPAGKNRQS